MSKRFLSTGQAARLCSVTPDTVRKWIYSGRLPARRTPGGHHRIRLADLQKVLGQRPESSHDAQYALQPGRFRYCWEYKNRGVLQELCRECVVYQLRAQRCYEVAKLPDDIGHARRYCREGCDQCDYYQLVHQQRTNIMVVTKDERLIRLLERDKDSAPYNLEITDCEYSCSALIDRFRADYVIVDRSLGEERASDICEHVREDPRLPHVRVVLATYGGELPQDCDRKTFARIEKPFLISDIARCVEGSRTGVVM